MPYYPPAGGGTTVNGSTGGISKLLMTQNANQWQGVNPLITKAGTITGTAGIGSSLFLQRITIPAPMAITEIDCLLNILFNATSDGAGTMSRSFGLYSFGNSSSLASVFSISGSSTWNTGTTTAGASTSHSQFQHAWNLNISSIPILVPMTFASSSITGGEYVVGQIFDFAQASSTWTLRLFGPVAQFSASAGTNIAVAAASGITGTAAASAFTATTATALTAWTAAASALTLNKVASTAALTTAAGSSILATATAASTASLLLNAGTGGAGLLSSAGLSAGSILTGVTAGSIITGTTAATVVNTGAIQIRYVGTGSGSSGASGQFTNGIMSTGALPVSIALTGAGITYTGVSVLSQPWFALIGS